jgi:hypothetical protein
LAVPKLSKVRDSHLNSEAAFDASGQDEALPSVTFQSVHRCPRCESTFNSTDRMLGHLNAHLRNPSVRDPGVAAQLSGLRMSTLELDAALDDLERTLREPDRPLGELDPIHLEPQRLRRQRMWVIAAVGLLPLVCGIVLITLGNAPSGISLIAVVFTLFAVQRKKRRRRFSGATRRNRS